MELSELLGYPVDTKSYGLGTSWVLPRQNIGLEFEVENVQNRYLKAFRALKAAKLWTEEEDGSLRNNGREFKSNGPLFGQDLLVSIEQFIEVAKKFNFVSSARCGLHVHLDINDLDNVTQFPMLCCLYALFERPLFKYAGWERSENNNCLPWFLADDHLEEVQGLFEEQDPQRFKQLVHDIQRYSALNLNSLVERPTVEFRHMEMIFDVEKIKGWINIIMSLKKGAIELSERMGYQELITYLSTHGADTLGQEVFGNYFNLVRCQDFSSLVWENLLLLEDLIILYKAKNRWELKPVSKDKQEGLAHIFLKKHPPAKKERQ